MWATDLAAGVMTFENRDAPSISRNHNGKLRLSTGRTKYLTIETTQELCKNHCAEETNVSGEMTKVMNINRRIVEDDMTKVRKKGEKWDSTC